MKQMNLIIKMLLACTGRYITVIVILPNVAVYLV